MKLGIHKLGFSDPTSFSDKDTNGMFKEVNLIASIFKEAGHNVEYVETKRMYQEKPKEMFDSLYVFNGFENSTSNLRNLAQTTRELNYILTDTRFLAEIEDEYVDNYFVQGPMDMFKKPTYNSMLHKLPIYENEQRLRQSSRKKERGHNTINQIIFGGSVRERKSKILEYIIRPETTHYLKFDELGYDTRVPLEDYREALRKHKYGIVLINPKDAVVGNITWRYYEYIINGCLTFVDRGSDPNLLLLPEDSFMRVSSYEEMIKKKRMLEQDDKLMRAIYSSQASRISPQDKWGVTFLESLLEKRYLNDR
jgi:hypothetical protein